MLSKSPQPGKRSIADGQKRFLVLLVDFPDQVFTTSNAQTEFSNLMNQRGYSLNGAAGSVRDYFYDNSKGSFEPLFDVYGPVTISRDYSYYGSNDVNGKDKHPDEIVFEACQLLDSQIDFRRYDNDGDNSVDLVFVFYAGYGEDDYDDEDTIMAGSGQLSYSLTLDGKSIAAFAYCSELCGQGPHEGKLRGIGMPCREFGHAFGLPYLNDIDMDVNGMAAGLFSFSLMADGWKNNYTHTPPYLTTEERIMLGWLDESTAYEEIPKSGTYTLEGVNSGKAYKIPTDQEGEYFVLECRDDNGWDMHLPSHGLIVYHVDKSSRKVRVYNNQYTASQLWSDPDFADALNENGSHPCYYIVPAVDQSNLSYGYEYDDYAGYSVFDPDDQGRADFIPFPGAGNIKTYTSKSWNGLDSDISLSNISASGGKVAFDASLPSINLQLDYYSICNPKFGAYSVGDIFELEVNAVPNDPFSSIQWYFDGSKVSGSSVTLTSAGAHTIKADIALQSGKRQIVTLEIIVK